MMDAAATTNRIVGNDLIMSSRFICIIITLTTVKKDIDPKIDVFIFYYRISFIGSWIGRRFARTRLNAMLNMNSLCRVSGLILDFGFSRKSN